MFSALTIPRAAEYPHRRRKTKFFVRGEALIDWTFLSLQRDT
jgi:hypothetical protein